MGRLLTARDITLYTPMGLPLFYAEGFSLNAGDFLHIQGENGSGKSTALKAFMGRYSYYSGDISRHYADERVAFLPQMGNTGYLQPLSLGDVISMSTVGSATSIGAKVDRLGLLEPAELDLSWNAASGGERQKALLTKTFLADADLIVLDEPFNHLAAAARQHVIKLIAEARQRGAAVIAVSHDAPALAEQASAVLRTDRESLERAKERAMQAADAAAMYGPPRPEWLGVEVQKAEESGSEEPEDSLPEEIAVNDEQRADVPRAENQPKAGATSGVKAMLGGVP